jgi:hypothetical protein
VQLHAFDKKGHVAVADDKAANQAASIMFDCWTDEQARVCHLAKTMAIVIVPDTPHADTFLIPHPHMLTLSGYLIPTC